MAKKTINVYDTSHSYNKTEIDSKVSTLETSITNESNTRASADSTLHARIDSEASVRSSTDNSLQNQINQILQKISHNLTISVGGPTSFGWGSCTVNIQVFFWDGSSSSHSIRVSETGHIETYLTLEHVLAYKIVSATSTYGTESSSLGSNGLVQVGGTVKDVSITDDLLKATAGRNITLLTDVTLSGMLERQ